MKEKLKNIGLAAGAATATALPALVNNNLANLCTGVCGSCGGGCLGGLGVLAVAAVYKKLSGPATSKER